MAAGVAKQDTGRTRSGHNRPDQHLVAPGHSSRKRHRSAEGKDEDIRGHRQKSRRVEKSTNQGPQNVPQESARPTRQSPRSQGRQPTKSQQTAKGGQPRVSHPQREGVKQYPEGDEGRSKTSKQQGVYRSAKRRRDEDQRDASQAKRPRRRLAQSTEARTGPGKQGSIENWLEEASWSRKAITEHQTGLSNPVIKMPRKASAVLPSPDKSLESTISRKSDKSTVSVHDTDYRQSLGYRNIYINHNDPPVQLMQRAKKIVSRSRASPEIDDTTAQELRATSRRVENESEDVIVQQLAPGIIPAMSMIPDQRLASNANQPWYNSVPVPLKPSILTSPLPLPKPKPDLAFGYSETAFTENQLGTIDLLIDDQFGRSYAVPDQKIRFPFLEIEFKSQAKNGTHYIATNQAAGTGAIALHGNMELIQRSFGMETFDYDEPQYFSITIDHQLACINVHWLKAPAEGGLPSFHVEGLSKHLLDDGDGIRAVSRAIKNILDHGTDARLRTICDALDAYRETVVRNREMASVPRRQERGIPKPQIKQQANKAPPDSRADGGMSFEKDDGIPRPPDEPADPLQAERRPQPAQKLVRGKGRSRGNLSLKAKRVSTRRTSRAVE